MYKRVLLKISGEALRSENEPVCFDTIERTVPQLRTVVEWGVQLGIVIGGGNIWRGRAAGSMDRNRADQMGMLATAINALAMQEALIASGLQATVLSAVEMPRFCDTYTSRKAQKLLEKGHILLFACGTGHPYFSTDTAAALRAAEIGADVLLLAKNVDAIYSTDPKEDSNAKRYDCLTTQEVIANGLKATDLTAIAFCQEHNIPILAFGLKEENSIMKAVRGDHIGTFIATASN